MPNNRIYLIVVGSVTILTVILGIVANIAANEIPDYVRPYLWLASTATLGWRITS